MVSTLACAGGPDEHSQGSTTTTTAVAPTSGPSSAAPERPPLGRLGLWLSVEQVPPGGAEVVAVPVNDDDRDVTVGLHTTLERWDGSSWQPHGYMVMCLISWRCVGENTDTRPEVADIGLAPGAQGPGPALRFSTEGLNPGWYRVTVSADTTSELSAMFDVADGARHPAPLQPKDRPSVLVEPALVTTHGQDVTLRAVLVPPAEGEPAPDPAEDPEVANLAEVVELERWDGTNWTAVAELDLRPNDDLERTDRTAAVPSLHPGEYRIVRGGPTGPHIGNLWVREPPD